MNGGWEERAIAPRGTSGAVAFLHTGVLVHPALTHRAWLCCENERGRTRLLSRQRIPYDVPMAEPPNGARPLAYHSRAPRARLWAPRQRFAHPPTFPFSATMQGVRAMASNLACSHLSFTGRSQSTCRVCRPPALCARWAPIADDRGRHAHDNDPMTIGPPR